MTREIDIVKTLELGQWDDFELFEAFEQTLRKWRDTGKMFFEERRGKDWQEKDALVTQLTGQQFCESCIKSFD